MIKKKNKGISYKAMTGQGNDPLLSYIKVDKKNDKNEDDEKCEEKK
jgi:hypothetical protein